MVIISSELEPLNFAEETDSQKVTPRLRPGDVTTKVRNRRLNLGVPKTFVRFEFKSECDPTGKYVNIWAN